MFDGPLAVVVSLEEHVGLLVVERDDDFLAVQALQCALEQDAVSYVWLVCEAIEIDHVARAEVQG